MPCSRAEARCILFDPTARNISTRRSVPITQPRPKLDARQRDQRTHVARGKTSPAARSLSDRVGAGGGRLRALGDLDGAKAGEQLPSPTFAPGRFWVPSLCWLAGCSHRRRSSRPRLRWRGIRWIGVAAAVATMGAAVASRSRHVESRRSLLVYRGPLFGLVLVAGIGVAFPAAETTGVHREAAATTRFKAIAFDYFTLFNPDSVVPEVERVFPGKGKQLTNLWRTRQFEYSWLRSITDRYVDFFGITEDALVYAANAMKLELTPDDKQHLLEAYLHLTPWRDTAGALSRLKEKGIRIITIANFSPRMLRSNAVNAGLMDSSMRSSARTPITRTSRIRVRIGWAWIGCISRRATSCSWPSEDGMPLAQSRSAIRPCG